MIKIYSWYFPFKQHFNSLSLSLSPFPSLSLSFSPKAWAASALGFLTKRFNAVSRNSETSETSGYFAKFFACFASVSRNISQNVSRNSEKLKISRNNSKIRKLWLTSHLFLFSFSRNKITVSVFRETLFAETACFAKQAKRPLLFRETAKCISRNVSRNSEKLKISRNNSKIGKLWFTSHLFLFSFSRNKITVSVFRETRFAKTACFVKQRNRRNDPFCFAKRFAKPFRQKP